MTITTTTDAPSFELDATSPGWVALLEPAARLAEVLARTEFVPKALRGRPEAVTAAILLGAELGIGPLQALSGIDVIEGRPAPDAELMRALVLRAGHDLWVAESSGNRVRMAGRRSGSTHTVEVEWSLDMARAAGLASKDVWKRYPRAMLTARATTELCRLLFPDVIGGLSYLAEELEPEPEQPSSTAAAAASSTKRVARRGRPTDSASPESEGTPTRPAAAEAVGTAAGSVSASRALTTADEARREDATSSASPPGALSGAPGGSSAAPPPASDGARRKLHALLSGVGIESRPDRLAFASEVAGRVIESSNELTGPEVGNLIDTLEQVAAGVVDIVWTEDPITSLRTPSLRLAEPEGDDS